MNYCLKIDVEKIITNGSIVSKQEVESAMRRDNEVKIISEGQGGIPEEVISRLRSEK